MRFIAIVLVAAACIETPPMWEPEIESSHVEFKEIFERPVTKLDMLVFVDDTVAMSPYADRRGAIAAALAESLHRIAGGWVDLRVGVTTNTGTLRVATGMEAPFLSDKLEWSYRRTTNYASPLDATLAELLDVGTENPGPSQPLDAIRRTLETHSQFLRDNAAFAIVIITATDDQSPAPVADYAAWLDRLNQSGWSGGFVLTGLAPQPAPRLDALSMALHAVRDSLHPIESGEYREAFDRLQLTQRSTLPAMCIEGDIVELAPGRYDCQLMVEYDGALHTAPQCPTTMGARTEAIPSSPSPPCWRVFDDRANCSPGKHLGFALGGYSLDRHPPFRFECVLQ